MQLILGVIGLFLEALYYSLFIKFSKNEGNIFKYLISFIIISIVGIFIDVSTLVSYFVLIAMIIIALKYIVKVKTSVYDLLFLFIMLIFKLFIEILFFLIFFNFTKNNYIMALLLGICKVPILLILKNKLNLLYNELEKYWNNNVFYIRYGFAILMLIYVILSCCFLVFNR